MFVCSSQSRPTSPFWEASSTTSYFSSTPSPTPTRLNHYNPRITPSIPNAAHPVPPPGPPTPHYPPPNASTPRLIPQQRASPPTALPPPRNRHPLRRPRPHPHTRLQQRGTSARRARRWVPARCGLRAAAARRGRPGAVLAGGAAAGAGGAGGGQGRGRGRAAARVGGAERRCGRAGARAGARAAAHEC